MMVFGVNQAQLLIQEIFNLPQIQEEAGELELGMLMYTAG